MLSKKFMLNGAAGVQSARRHRTWNPSLIANQIARWDLALSTVSTTAGSINSISDLVGTNTLIAPWAGLAKPTDTTTYANLNNRRACKHDYSIDVQDIGKDTLGDTGTFTFAMVFAFDSVTVNDSIFELADSGYASGYSFFVSAGPVFELRDSNSHSYTGGTPAANTAYLLVFELNGVSSKLKINGTTIISSTAGMSSFDIGLVNIGYESFHFATGGKLSWTFAVATSDIMSASDQAKLLTWAQANCGVA